MPEAGRGRDSFAMPQRSSIVAAALALRRSQPITTERM